MRSSLAIATNGYFRLQPQCIAVEGYLLRMVSLGLKVTFGDGQSFAEVERNLGNLSIRENGNITNLENQGFAEAENGSANIEVQNGCKYV